MNVRLFAPRAARGETGGLGSAIGRDACALILLMLAAYTALALATLRLDAEAGENWMGVVGETLASVLALGFGAVAWVVPLEIGLLAAPLLRRRPIGPFGVRLAGDLMIAIILAALTQVAFPDSRYLSALPAGGNVGLFFGELLRGLFSAPGSFLIGFTAIGLILIARSAFSFIDWCERVMTFARKARAALRVFAQQFGAWLLRRTLLQRLLRAGPWARWLPAAGFPLLSAGDGRSPWQQGERTGVPPPAVAQTIR